jgi:hypothetical protein
LTSALPLSLRLRLRLRPYARRRGKQREERKDGDADEHIENARKIACPHATPPFNASWRN